MTEFTVLALSAPGPDASVERVAAWYEAKGRLHERLADGAGPVEAVGELAYAAAAYEHARRLTHPRPAGVALVGGRAS